MACTDEFIEHVCRQIGAAGVITTRRMFGEWMVYVNAKPIVLCCDNVAYVHKHPVLDEVAAHAECGYPYQGAKEKYILPVDFGEEALRWVMLLEAVTPIPVKKRRKK